VDVMQLKSAAMVRQMERPLLVLPENERRGECLKL
jgi:hypothetical protein